LPTPKGCDKQPGMIARLSGKLVSVAADHAIIDVNGVGYLVFASARTLTALGNPDDAVVVHTELQVSENDMRLMGFASAVERDWYRLLISVQGVGGKVALAILSALDTEELKRAIGGSDSAMVARAQGVGPKLASRICNELKDKVGALPGMPGVASDSVAHTSPGSASADAVSALTNLGFKPAIAATAVAQAEGELGDGADLDALVRVALKKAAR
jgi:holliday junction DNA helicase RuvA